MTETKKPAPPMLATRANYKQLQYTSVAESAQLDGRSTNREFVPVGLLYVLRALAQSDRGLIIFSEFKKG